MSESETPLQFVTEQWTYAGIRVFAGEKRSHLWIDPGGKELYYTTKGSYVIGGIYDVEVNRKPGNTQTRNRRYTGKRVDQERCQELYAQDLTARSELEKLARERSDIRRDELEEALEPLVRIAKTLRTQYERDAFGASVLRRIHNAAWK